MKLLFSSPALDDLIRLLKAWRFWSVGAVVGGLIGAGFYYLMPPPYRAHAIVVVDFNLEQALPQDTDRQYFYYLERETRKLEETAYSDVVMEAVAAASQNVTTDELQNGMLFLSQPAEGGWNFYVDDPNPDRASTIASIWATQFANQVHIQAGSAQGPNALIEATVTRSAARPVTRSLSISLYVFVGAVIVLVIGSIGVLFIGRPDGSVQ